MKWVTNFCRWRGLFIYFFIFFSLFTKTPPPPPPLSFLIINIFWEFRTPQLWEVRKGVGVHQSQLKNQAADVLTSATTGPRSNILALAVVGFALAPQNGAKLFVYLFILAQVEISIAKRKGQNNFVHFKFSFFALATKCVFLFILPSNLHSQGE